MAVETQYDIGDQVRLTAAFTDTVGAAADPTAVTFRIKEPDGTITSYVYVIDPELVQDSTGNYHVDFIITMTGAHYYRFEGTGAVHTADEKEFRVSKSFIV